MQKKLELQLASDPRQLAWQQRHHCVEFGAPKFVAHAAHNDTVVVGCGDVVVVGSVVVLVVGSVVVLVVVVVVVVVVKKMVGAAVTAVGVEVAVVNCEAVMILGSHMRKRDPRSRSGTVAHKFDGAAQKPCVVQMFNVDSGVAPLHE